MTLSLFSSFDPASSLFSLNYLIMVISLLMFFSNKTMKKNRVQMTLENLKQTLNTEIMSTSSNPFLKGKTNMLLSIFFLILVLNMLGLFPYVFTFTAHLSLNLSLALMFWMSFILFNFFKSTNMFMAHMVPLNTPMALSQFMTLIETISMIIRPITLSVRLTANMTAGHILMALTCTPILILNMASFPLTLLFLLETAVAIIQSYVFTILLTMYLSETSH